MSFQIEVRLVAAVVAFTLAFAVTSSPLTAVVKLAVGAPDVPEAETTVSRGSVVVETPVKTALASLMLAVFPFIETETVFEPAGGFFKYQTSLVMPFTDLIGPGVMVTFGLNDAISSTHFAVVVPV